MIEIERLKEQGFTKWKIAKELGVSWQTIHMWEKGVFKPTDEKLKQLKELFTKGD